MAKVVKEYNIGAPIKVNRWQITEETRFDGTKDYAISSSKNGICWSSIGELSRDNLIELAILINQFINETKKGE